MNAFVTDTHPLVFYAGDVRRKLSKKALRLFTGVESGAVTMYVPALVSLEIWLLARGGRISVPSTLAAWWRGFADLAIVHEPFAHDDVLGAVALSWDHADIFDRSIVATARRLGLPLLTADQAITDAELVDVVW